MLAYLFLAAAEQGLTRSELDRAVEDWLASGWDCRIDFEVDDALNKLAHWGLLHRAGERTQVLAPAAAKTRLDRIWDAYFEDPSSDRGDSEPAAITTPI